MAGGGRVVTEEGQVLDVVYPGRPNDDRGGDFRDAVIATGSGLTRGDIEIHVRSSDWRAHGHDRDAAYDNVVLHVVQRHDSRRPTRRHGGGTVPVVALERCRGRPEPAVAGRGGVDAGTLGRLLDLAGDCRLLTKAGALRRAMEAAGPGQALYRGLMEAMGYSRNRQPFLALADRLPLAALAETGERPDHEASLRMQARLLGTAGLLPSQRRLGGDGDGFVALLETAWHRCPGEAIPPGSWRLFRVRPQNSPVRRLAAISHLLCRYRPEALVAAMLALVRGGRGQGPGHVERGLVVPSRGYWVDHFDFGRTARGLGSSLLGRQRAADIAINVLLPFALAWAESCGDAELRAGVLELYRGYPRLTPNTVEKHMQEQLAVGRKVLASARRQQGALLIYRDVCARGGCRWCRLGCARTRIARPEGAAAAGLSAGLMPGSVRG